MRACGACSGVPYSCAPREGRCPGGLLASPGCSNLPSSAIARSAPASLPFPWGETSRGAPQWSDPVTIHQGCPSMAPPLRVSRGSGRITHRYLSPRAGQRRVDRCASGSWSVWWSPSGGRMPRRNAQRRRRSSWACPSRSRPPCSIPRRRRAKPRPFFITLSMMRCSSPYQGIPWPSPWRNPGRKARMGSPTSSRCARDSPPQWRSVHGGGRHL